MKELLCRGTCVPRHRRLFLCTVRVEGEGYGAEGCIPAPIASAPEPPTPARRRMTIMTAILFEAPEAAVNIMSSGKVIQ